MSIVWLSKQSESRFLPGVDWRRLNCGRTLQDRKRYIFINTLINMVPADDNFLAVTVAAGSVVRTLRSFSMRHFLMLS